MTRVCQLQLLIDQICICVMFFFECLSLVHDLYIVSFRCTAAYVNLWSFPSTLAKSLLPACCVTADFKEIELAQDALTYRSLSRVTYLAVISEDHMESFPSPAI